MKFLRSLAPATCIEPGEWTMESASGAPAVCCELCESTSEIDRRVAVDGVKPTINEDGIVEPTWKCPCCGVVTLVWLESWGEEVLK